MLKLLILTLLIPGAVLASKGGGGGLVVACYQDDKLTKVELLDMYEGSARGIKYGALSGNFDKDVRNIAMKITKNKKHAEYLISRLNKLTASYQSIPVDSELEPTNDAYPAFLPRGCKAKQVANYYNDRLVWIDTVLFEKMSYRDQVALAFHETIYYMERIYRPKTDSRYTRMIVAHAFNAQDSFEPIKSNYEYYCIAGGTDNYTTFLAKKIEGSREFNYEFSFVMLYGHFSFTKKIAHVNINPLAVENSDSDRDDFPPSLMSAAKIKSKINSDEEIIVASSNNTLMMGWRGTDPGDYFDLTKAQCFKLHPDMDFSPYSMLD